MSEIFTKMAEVVDAVNNNNCLSKNDIRLDPLVNWGVLYEERSDTDMEQSDDLSTSESNTPRRGTPAFGSQDSDSDTETESTEEESQKKRVRLRRRASLDEKLIRKSQIPIFCDNLNRRMAKTSPGTPIEHGSSRLKNFHAENLSSALFLGSILCADRVSQMTRTYNDIEALTRMLEEKERDLELAARIGQTLLEKNKDLTERSDELEDQLVNANDKASQLRHDVSMKDELLKIYCQDYDTDASTPGEEKGFSLKLVNIEALQTKVVNLEEDNQQLKLESNQLKSETCSYEEKEKKLVEDCLAQLSEVNIQVDTFAEELARKSDESAHQKEEITNLLAKVVDQQKRVRCLTVENMELSKHLQASQESQRKLTSELGYRQDRYDELLEVLADTQEEMKSLRGKQRPGVSCRQYLSTSLLSVPSDSLASELESSLRNDPDGSSRGMSPTERKAQNWKIFETAKAAKKASGKRSPGSNSTTSRSGADSDSASYHRHPANFYFSDADSIDGYSADNDSWQGSNPDLGRPGIPGSNDLESSLKRLAMRRANELNERDFYKEDDKRRHHQHHQTSTAPRTPESLSSPGSGLSFLSYPGSHHNNNSPYFKIPDKLQIVKPLEGSVTLRQWQQLATPNLGGIFENRPGVQIKGERKLDLQEEVYRLSDFEEDDDLDECPSKRYEESSTVFTLTDSMVKNPNDRFTPAPTTSISSLSTISSSAVYQTPSTPSEPIMSSQKGRVASLKGSNTCTYSMSLGLAAILNERDLSKQSNQIHPTRLQSIVTDTPFSSIVPLTTASASSLPGATATASSSTASTPTEGGFLDKLKNTGYSIYGFLGGGRSEDDDSSSSDASSALPRSSTERSFVTGVAAPTTAASPNTDKNIAKTLFTQGGSAGVLGALTSFRRGGIL